jgi:DHA3 family tetracycline resistance protein-like MFS transporter
LTALLALALFAFAFTSSLLALVVTYWVVVALRHSSRPVLLTWINRGLDPSVRATVISMHSQGDSLGQVTFGPVIGIIATIRSIRFGLAIGAAALVPALGLLVIASRRDSKPS